MARKIILSKFNFFYFKVVRVCSFVCCNGVCKSGLPPQKPNLNETLERDTRGFNAAFLSFSAVLFTVQMSKLKGLEKTRRKRICSSSKDFPRPLWGRYISAALAKSGPRDITSEKSFLLFFIHENGLGHMFQKQFSCSPILLFCVSSISRK